MQTPFSEEEKVKLLEEFKKLQTIEEKFLFWENSLNSKYITFLIATSNASHRNPTKPFFDALYEFRIVPKSHEYLVYNNLVLDRYRNQIQIMSNNNKLLNLDDFKEDFEKHFKEVSNKKEFIELEIKRVNDIVERRSSPNPDNFDNSNTFFSYSFNADYLNNQPLDLSKQPYYDIENILAYVNGEVVSQYLKFVKATLENLESKPTKKTETLSLEEQILVLDYLGLYGKTSRCNSVGKRAKLIGLIVNKDEFNIRGIIPRFTDLTYSKIGVEKKKIKQRLAKISNLFEEVGLNALSKKVSADLKKVDK
ncbi:hypothetical protein [Ferruginibacter sp.]